MNRALLGLTVAALLFSGCLDYTVDDFADNVQLSLGLKKAARTPLPPTPEPTIVITPRPTPTAKPTPIPTQAPHTRVGVVNTDKIVIALNQFKPQQAWVAAGTTVTWENQDGLFHGVKSLPGSPRDFDSGNIAGRNSWSHYFETPGKYEYFDTISRNTGVLYVE